MNTDAGAALDHVVPLTDASPIAVGGVGGSGTRVVARLLQCAGVNIGTDLNESLDDLCFTVLFKRHDLYPPSACPKQLNEALEIYLACRGIAPFSEIAMEAHHARLGKIQREREQANPWIDSGTLSERITHMASIPEAPSSWGWKEPNTHIFLPYLIRAIPKFRYVHVMRDGQDMAFSSNQNQLTLWGPKLLGYDNVDCVPAESFAYWCAAHSKIVALQARYPRSIVLLRFEELIANPQKIALQLLGSLSLTISDDNLAIWCQRVDKGRRLQRSRETTLRPSEEQKLLLLKLGYNPHRS